MDTEQLKMILDAMQDVGGDAKIAFIWYMVAITLQYCIGWVLGVGGVLIVCRMGVGLIKKIATDSDNSRRLRVAAGYGACSGRSGDWSFNELEKVCRFLSDQYDKDEAHGRRTPETLS